MNREETLAETQRRKGSEEEDPETLYRRGMDLIDELKPAEAAECFLKAAEQGHAEAQFNLGICYEDGDGVPWSYIEAVKWYTKAAEQGHEEAKMLLDILLEIIEEETDRSKV